MRKNNAIPLVLIDWVDAYGHPPQWEIVGASPEPLYCRSIGWLTSSTRTSKTVTASISDPDLYPTRQGCASTTIPTRCIIRMYRLPDPRKRLKRTKDQKP